MARIAKELVKHDMGVNPVSDFSTITYLSLMGAIRMR